MGDKTRWRILVAGLRWLFVGTGQGFGSGFALYAAGARNSLTPDAVVARADDLSAMFCNPAGPVQLPKIKIMSTFIPRVEIVTQLGPVATSDLMQSPVSFVPSTDRCHNLSRGTGFHWRALTLDLAYTMVLIMTARLKTLMPPVKGTR